jgi:indolepyruvate ferredoxin oxidoreductase beta subunit
VALNEVQRQRIAALPEPAREYATLGVARLVDYQDAAYADLYLERLAPFTVHAEVAREVARQLAVRMSYEDIARVAQIKASAERLARVRADVGAGTDEPLEIVDYFRPGIPEIADLLPVGLGRRLRAWAERRGRLDKPGPSLHNRSTTVNGYLRIWLLAKMRRWRRKSLRYAEEQAAITAWLALIERAQAVSPEFAVATAALARVVKGYGETYQRGRATYAALVAAHVEPVLAAEVRPEAPHRAVREALEHALATAI